MAKKVLIDTTKPSGNNGYRCLEVVDVGSEFDVHSNLEWKDCSDSVTGMDNYWWDPVSNTAKKLPHMVDQSTAGDLAEDADGNPTEKYVWNWDTETWNKQSIS